MNSRAQEIIQCLGLKPHEEGGYFTETYRSSEVLAPAALPERFTSERVFSTSIYFLLEGSQVSRLHRMKADEVWHFYEGSPLEVVMLNEEGEIRKEELNPAKTAFQLNVPAGVWIGAQVLEPKSYCLVGCTVSPGFEFADFELASRGELVARFPEHRELILTYTAK